MQKCWCGNKVLEKYSEHYYICRECNTLVSDVELSEKILNITDENEDLYGKNYWEKLMLSLTNKSTLDEVIDLYLQERAIYWTNYILKYKLPPASVAEIGGGLGQFSYLLKQLGYNQTMFELSPSICDYARTKLDIDAQVGEMNNSTGEYDMIVAFDLLEHIIEPQKFMENCTRHMKESGGIICIQTPCFDPSLSYCSMQTEKSRFQTHLTEFQHVFLYSKNSIEELLYSVGFKYIEFEKPIFGEDYDMFLFASKNKMTQNSKSKIDDYLNNIGAGRLYKSMKSLYKQVVEKQAVIEELAQYKDYIDKRVQELESK